MRCLDYTGYFDINWLINIIRPTRAVSWKNCCMIARNNLFSRCHASSSLNMAIVRILPNYFATYIPITLVMIANPIMYKSAIKDMQRVITAISGQFTSKEREIMDSIKMKFSLINLVFYICWIPNLINGLLIWILWFRIPLRVIIVLWYIMVSIRCIMSSFV